jgi:hypothetical protein
MRLFSYWRQDSSRVRGEESRVYLWRKEIELGKEELDAEGSEVDSDVLILEKGSRLMEQAMREVARQLALVARVDVDIFTDALLGWVFDVMCQRRAGGIGSKGVADTSRKGNLRTLRDYRPAQARRRPYFGTGGYLGL